MKRISYILLLFVQAFLLTAFTATDYPLARLTKESKVVIRGNSNLHPFKLDFSFGDYPGNISMECMKQGEKLHLAKPIHLTLPVDRFDCRNILLKEDFKKTLNAKAHPNIEIFIHDLGFNIQQGNNSKAEHMRTKIILGGVQGYEEVYYNLYQNSQDEAVMAGTLVLDMTNYGIEAKPRLLGLIQVSNLVEIDFIFKFVFHQSRSARQK